MTTSSAANEQAIAVVPEPAWRSTRMALIQGALISLSVVLVAGLLSALYTVPAIGAVLPSFGLQFTHLRPLHTVFAAAWMVLAGIAVVFWFFERTGKSRRPLDRFLCKLMVVSWAFAGAGILITVPMGYVSGREYMGYHPIWSVPILLGWLAFATIFFRAIFKGFWDCPVYIMMWAVGSLFFVFTFAEQHLWLVDQVFADPIMDRRIQWMATGTIVGAINLFVYGALYYAGDWLSGDDSFGRCGMGWALFGLGLLNSFVNFGHHTYHLPQSQLVHWISFVISMTEVLVLFRVMGDLVDLARTQKQGEVLPAKLCLVAAKWWTGILLIESILLSIPPVNALLHGTWVVAGHAMTGMIGLDSMVLFGAVLVMLSVDIGDWGGAPERTCDLRLRGWIKGTNIVLFFFVSWFHVVGVLDGYFRYMTPPDIAYAMNRPVWLAQFAGVFCALFGSVLAVLLGGVVMRLLRVAFSPERFPSSLVSRWGQSKKKHEKVTN